MCAKSKCDNSNRTKTLRAHSRVHQVCHVIVGFRVLCVDLGFHLVIGVGRPTVQREGFRRPLHFTMHTQCSDFVLSPSAQSVSQILAYFTSRKRVL